MKTVSPLCWLRHNWTGKLAAHKCGNPSGSVSQQISQGFSHLACDLLEVLYHFSNAPPTTISSHALLVHHWFPRVWGPCLLHRTPQPLSRIILRNYAMKRYVCPVTHSLPVNLWSSISQPWHYWHLWPDNSVLERHCRIFSLHLASTH